MLLLERDQTTTITMTTSAPPPIASRTIGSIVSGPFVDVVPVVVVVVVVVVVLVVLDGIENHISDP